MNIRNIHNLMKYLLNMWKMSRCFIFDYCHFLKNDNCKSMIYSSDILEEVLYHLFWKHKIFLLETMNI